MWASGATLTVAVLVACSTAPDGAESVGAGSSDNGTALAYVDEREADDKVDATVGSIPTTTGSGLPAVTTIPGTGGVGSLDGYTGTIGRLAPDEILAEPVAPPPARREGVFPLTGLPGEVPDRPAAVVKIDNGAAAVPQVGLNAADIVIEEEVEGGVTRFAAVFHSTSSIVGPVRSGRTTDVALISGLGSPLLLYSGANDLTETVLRRQHHIQNHSHSTTSGYWRDES
ncbi:MAG: DUF3048 domain-containing protein, partial [Acidimicrobiia bacterium]|nr:DUF3048 domain-containing protein [Acidimicrobiia bacterium]